MPRRHMQRLNTPPDTFTINVRVDVADGVLTAAGTRYPVKLAPVNVPSDDGRVIVDTLGWREPPLPFMASDSEMGHGDAIHVGTLTDFATETIDDVQWVTATLEYDNDDDAVEFERLANDQGFRFVSIHLSRARWAPVIRNDDGTWTELTPDNIDDMIDDRGVEIMDDVYDGFFDAEIGMATQVGMPAFADAAIDVGAGQPTAGNDSDDDDDTDDEMSGDTLVASMNLARPPAEWFADPELDGPTGVTVTDDGRVFGHLALWNTCHTGYRGQCVTVPDNPDYSLFMQCAVTDDAGTEHRVGPLVVDEGHAPVEWSVPRAMTHYSSTALVAAYVTVGHDEHGVWVAGAVSPNATDGMIETLRRHPLSGDWRTTDTGEYALIAAVSVNAPGFAVRPRVMVAAGADDPSGLVTFGPAPIEEADQTTLGLLTDAVNSLVDMFGSLAVSFEALAATTVLPDVESTIDDDDIVDTELADATTIDELDAWFNDAAVLVAKPSTDTVEMPNDIDTWFTDDESLTPPNNDE